MKKRWYELSPDVCIVISKIELVKEDDRIRYAKVMLSELRKAGYVPDKNIYLEKSKEYKMQRWYDKNKFLFLAFEYLKDSESEIQHSVVTNVLKFMREENVA